ncbi:hypothetical protein [Mesorhizobium helmanticense]|nr:hypothetical protein [Mesorhizobium helmanticense]
MTVSIKSRIADADSESPETSDGVDVEAEQIGLQPVGIVIVE